MKIACVHFANDPSKLGSEATTSDLNDWIARVVEALEKEFDLTILWSVGSYERDHCLDNVEVNDRLNQINQTDEWVDFLS